MTLNERIQQMEKQVDQTHDLYLRSVGAYQMLKELRDEGYELCKPEQPEQETEE